MSVEKAKIKVGTLNALGSKLDDALEVAEKSANAFEGGKSALKSAKQKVEALYKHVDKDIDEEKVPADGEVLTVARYTKRYIGHAVNLIEQMEVAAGVNVQRALGKADGLRDAVKATKADVDAEVNKMTAIANALETGAISIEDGEDLPERPSGVHPGNPVQGRKEPPTEAQMKKMKKEELLELALMNDVEMSEDWSKTRMIRTLEEHLQKDAENT